MAQFAIENLTFSYPTDPEHPSLRGVSLQVEQGEYIALCGKSGSGKTTLLRHLKTVLTPHGNREGTILYDGAPLDRADLRKQSSEIGFVMQNPDSQIVTDKVWHELAFGLESLGCDQKTMRLRVAEMASYFGIQGWFHRDVAELSGGQKQLLNLASIMAMQPKVLILDEPTSQLDPIAASDFLNTVKKINRELGTTVLITEHRLEDIFHAADRCVVMENGRILADDAPKKVGQLLYTQKSDMFSAMPAPVRIFYGAGETGAASPLTVREGRSWLTEKAAGKEVRDTLPPQPELPEEIKDPALEVKEIWYRYEKDSPDILKGVSFRVPKGTLFSIVGGNGTGKSTTLKAICGICRPYRGKVRVDGQDTAKCKDLFHGKLAMLPQDPQCLFVKKTVREDLEEMLPASCPDKARRIEDMARLCDITALLDHHPYDLSGGEQQRAALAKILLTRPDILLLDEPTRGLDAAFKAELAELLQSLLAQGVTVVLVSHDVEFCAAYAQRCALFFDGSIASDGAPREFFALNRFYTTAANRMARGRLPEAVTAEDVIAACGGREAPQKERREPPPQPPKAADIPAAPPEKRRLSPRTAASALVALLLIPLTLVFGPKLLGDRSYYAVSLLMVLEAMLPFFLTFEGRNPRARELVVTAVLCALGVAGRAAFFMLPQCKPVLALTILAGAALGGETGFLVGAATMLVSNILFSQGPWTPWQMLGMGLCGFLAGLVFHRGGLPRKREALCAYGAVSAFLVYGILLNAYSALLATGALTWQSLAVYCASGFAMDAVQAGSTAVFLWFFTEPMLDKLERVKIKYGFM